MFGEYVYGNSPAAYANLIWINDADRLNRVHGLARLGDRNDQGLLRDNGVAVAELGGEFDLDGDAAPVFNRVARNLSRVGSGAAADHDDFVDSTQNMLGDANFIEGEVPMRIETISEGVGDTSGLFVDLLLHEGRPAALRRTIRSEIDFELLVRHDRSVVTDDRHPLRGHKNLLILIDLECTRSVLDEGEDIGAEEVLVLA